MCVGGGGRDSAEEKLALERSLGGEEDMGPEDIRGKMALDRGRASAEAPRRHLPGMFEGCREVIVAGTK